MIRGGRIIFPALLAGAVLSGGRRVEAGTFIRGDVDGGGRVTISDAVNILRYLFQGSPEAVACARAADLNDDGLLGVGDAIYLLNFLFVAGPPPPPPFPGCWFDLKEDRLACDSAAGCGSIGVFFVLDRSATAGVGFAKEKSEVLFLLSQLKSPDQFGLVFFDANTIKFPPTGVPAEASPAMLSAAESMIQSTQTGHGTCTQAGLLAALAFADGSTAPRKVIVLVSDGYAPCNGQDESQYEQETIVNVTKKNTGLVEIHCIGIPGASGVNATFLKQLASKNHGSYTLIRL
jgi:hypothetical protein